MLTAPSTADLAEFTGRDEDSFSAFAAQALAQATLLFSVVTKRSEYPDDADAAQLARYAILEMADRILLEQPYAAARATPYQSETIGSYSYAKGSAAAKARDGERTGLLWWDLAIDELSLAERSIVASGSVNGGVERQSVYSVDLGDGEQRYLLGPAETDPDDSYAFVNAELNPRPRLG